MLTGVHVVDVEAGAVIQDQTVVISGNRVLEVGDRGTVQLPPDSRSVDVSGHYVIPGLWDLHTHNFDLTGGIDYVRQFPLLVANGVTGVREIGASGRPLEEMTRLRAEVLAGRLTGPRFIMAGPLVDGPERRHLYSVVPRSPEHARHVVDSLAAAGADFIKVYANLRPDVYRAIADQANRVGVPFAGHLPYRIRLAEAVALGQRSFEHLHAPRWVCSDAGDLLAKAFIRLDEALAAGADTIAAGNALDEVGDRLKTTHDAASCREAFALLAENGVAVVPTMVVNRKAGLTLDSLLADDRLRYVSRETREWWEEEMGEPPSPEERRVLERFFERERALIQPMHEAGVPLLAGTDIVNEYTYTGFSLHDELATFVEAGLSPLEALRMAPLNPAEFLEATDSLGTVEAGKLADLVLLEADPLEDIGNTKKIAAVVLNGRYLGRPALDALLQRGEPYAYEVPPRTGDGWPTASAAEVGLDVARLERMTDVIRGGEEYPNVHAVLIVRDGRLVYEEYFEGEDRRYRDGERHTVSVEFHRDTLHSVRSVGKSMTSALAGIALAEGALPSLDTPLFPLLTAGEPPASDDAGRITLRHALTMSAGLDWNEGEVPYTDSTNHSERLDASADPVEFLRERPSVGEPGTLWSYNSGLPLLVGLAIARGTGTPFGRYAREALFEPLGITHVEWTGPAAWRELPELRWDGSAGGHGVASPTGGQRVRPRDLAKFGALYLDEGRWKGRQVVPASWIRESTRHHIAVRDSISDYGEHGYGYLWWHDRFRTAAGPIEVHTAVGNGAQRVFVIPSLGMLVVHLAGRYNEPEAFWMPERLLLEQILPAVGDRP